MIPNISWSSVSGYLGGDEQVWEPAYKIFFQAKLFIVNIPAFLYLKKFHASLYKSQHASF